MNRFARWCRFALVGAMGVGVQLAVLAALNRVVPGHLLLATAGAVEITLLHNLAWHLRYTWRDRSGDGGWGRAMGRFHLSNGLVSLMGNLALMRLLIGWGHLPLLAANAVAIVCCSMVNFWMGDVWAFAAPCRSGHVPHASAACRMRGRAGSPAASGKTTASRCAPSM